MTGHIFCTELIEYESPGAKYDKMVATQNTIVMVMHYFARYILKYYLSYDVASGSEITSCNKIDKPLFVYRFTGKVMTSISTLRT